METRQTTNGLEGIYWSPIPESGLIKYAKWERVSLNLEGTFSINQEEDELTDIFVEEQDIPLKTVGKKGKIIVESDIPDFKFSVAERLLGAYKETGIEQDGETGTMVYLPSSFQYLYGMFKVVPKEGVNAFFLPYAQISSYISGNLSKTETLNIHMKLTALIPLKGETEAFMYMLKEGINPGYLTGLPLADDFDFATTFGAVTDGALGVTIDGGAIQNLSALDFSAVTDGAGVCTVLNAATTGAKWTFNPEEFRFVLTSGTVGTGSTVAVSAPGAGTNIITSSFLNMAGVTPVPGS